MTHINLVLGAKILLIIWVNFNEAAQIGRIGIIFSASEFVKKGNAMCTAAVMNKKPQTTISWKN